MINWKQIGLVVGAIVGTFAISKEVFTTTGQAYVAVSNANEVPELKRKFDGLEVKIDILSKGQEQTNNSLKEIKELVDKICVEKTENRIASNYDKLTGK